MARDAIITLDTLRCTVEGDASGGSEPYIWPTLTWIDDTTLQTPELVGITAPPRGVARVVIANDMRAGQSADIPASVRTLRLRLEEGLEIQQLVLAVALWENDESPAEAVKSGFDSFVATLRSAFAENLFDLGSDDEDIVEAATRRVQQTVEAAVRSAIEGALTGWQKARVLLGTLNLDDIVGNDFRRFDVENVESFELNFQAVKNDRITQSYTLGGSLRVRPVPVELCPEEAEAVKRAQAAVAGIDAAVRALQEELRSAPPGLKPFLVSEIRRLKQEELPEAMAALEAARVALQACRNRGRGPTRRPSGPPVIALASDDSA